ncbi:MAG: MarR family transcriptional regulator [Candidatus Cloacimonadota bacterium]|nr:MarR family transcriptional regulator [Candidatus Cloacimonadota bacterium]
MKKNLGKYFAFLGRKTHQELDRILKPIGVNASTYRVLSKAYREPGITQNEIAEFFNIDKANITRAVNKLLVQKLLICKTDKEDKRKHRLYLTENGKEITMKMENYMNKWQNLVLKDFSKAEKRQLYILMDKIVNNLKKTERERDART